MDPTPLLHGLVLGIGIAAPVGPIGLLCIRRTLAEGRARGLATGLGAATADAVYGAVAAFGLTFISGLLLAGQGVLRLLGGLFLCYLGWRTARTRPAQQPAAGAGRGLWGAYLSTVGLTLTNPMTILSFGVLFAGLGLAGTGDYGTAAALVAGVALGSTAWWLLLTSAVGLLRGRVDSPLLLWVNRLAGVGIAAFGLWILVSLLG
ncbi:MAG: LysE family transporter [Chloroflexota bacterium]|nr:LysE family transporter [Chloroflexota bacterium]